MGCWRGLIVIVLAAVACASCGTSLASGSYGKFRFIGQVKGTPPLSVQPPISDRTGNLYTAYGAIGLPQVVAFVSKESGGSQQACTLTKGDTYGLHQWVGFAQDRAWYWSGAALVLVTDAGACAAVLNVDPSTNADLQFAAVMPWVNVTSTRNTLVALIQSTGDPVPFSALVDLDRGITTNVVALSGQGPVTVIGVGADPNGGTRVSLVARPRSDGKALEAEFFDSDANLTASVGIAANAPPEYGIVGSLQISKSGTVVGLTSLGTLIAFDTSGGGKIDLDTSSFTPVGLHRWNDALYLVGTPTPSSSEPMLVALDDTGHPGAPVPWMSAQNAAQHLTGIIQVSDDRTFPARDVAWTNPVTAIGPAPFVGPQSPFPQGENATVWVIAGPSDNASTLPVTSIAIVPVGITYP